MVICMLSKRGLAKKSLTHNLRPISFGKQKAMGFFSKHGFFWDHQANMTLGLMFALTVFGGIFITYQMETQTQPSPSSTVLSPSSTFFEFPSWLWPASNWVIASPPKTLALTCKRTASHENMFWFEFDGPSDDLAQWRLDSLWFSVANSSSCLAIHPFWHRDGHFDTLERFRYWRHYLRLTLKPSGKYRGDEEGGMGQRLNSMAFELNIPNHSLLCSFCSSPWINIHANLTQAPSFSTMRTISHLVRIVH